MGLFSNRGSSEGGCDHHHFPDREEYNENWMAARVTGRSHMEVDISIPLEAECLHKDCEVVDREYYGRTFRVRKEVIELADSASGATLADRLRDLADSVEPAGGGGGGVNDGDD